MIEGFRVTKHLHGSVADRGAGRSPDTRASILLWRHSAIWLSILFVASRAVVFLFMAGRGTDLGVHSGYAEKIIAGNMPFKDFFPEYPPLVFIFTGIPALLDHSLRWYFPIFRSLCCGVDILTWLLLLRRNIARPLQSLLYVVCSTALGPLLYDRIDIVLGFLLLLAIAESLKGRHRTSFLAVGTGIAFKFIPVIWVPALLAFESKRGIQRFCWAVLLLALPTVMSFNAMAMLGGSDFGELFWYHSIRGIQIESTPANVEMTFMWFGPPGTVTCEFGSVNLHTAYEPAILRVTNTLLASSILASCFIAMRRKMGSDGMSLLLCAVLSAALFLSKVLSPQFLLILLPVLSAQALPPNRLAATAHCLLVLAIFAMTGAMFPWCYSKVIELVPWAEVILVARNVCLGILAISLFYRAIVAADSGGDVGGGSRGLR